MGNKRVLFVVEGSKTENKYVVNTFKRVMRSNDEEINVHKYSTNIYGLYDVLQTGEYDSFIDYLRIKEKRLFRNNIKPSDYFSAIYLVFDLDPQDLRFSISKCEWLINYFNDETRNGKLYFNYPMVEAMFDCTTLNQKHFNNRKVSRIGLSSASYKTHISRTSIIMTKSGFSFKKRGILYSIINLNVNKYFFLINEPRNNSYSSQDKLLKAEKLFLSVNKISVINSSMLILHDYNGTMLDKLSKE